MRVTGSIEVIRKYTEVDELDAGILNELIDKILVHEKEEQPDGTVIRQIEIYYRFVGKLDSNTECVKTES